jgi:AcrR family transcriptional regulator
MHHIPNDKRAQKSAELIYEGLVRCLEDKPLDQVTITDLQRESGVARTTFYRSFDNISDVLHWKCAQCFEEILGSFSMQDFADETRLVRRYFAYWAQHADILEVLMASNRYDVIYACHMEAASKVQEQLGAQVAPGNGHERYFLAIRTGFTVSVLTAWLQGGCKETPDEVVSIVREQMELLVRS